MVSKSKNKQRLFVERQFKVLFTVSRLHNAFQVVVQVQTHCWLSLTAAVFFPSYGAALPEICASENRAGLCQQPPAPRQPAAPVPARPEWELGSFPSCCPTQVAALPRRLVGVMGSPVGPGIGKQHMTQDKLSQFRQVCKQEAVKIPGKV